jgi:hypothetical protein
MADAHYTIVSKEKLNFVKREEHSSRIFTTCIVKQCFQRMYTTKIESCDVKVYENAKKMH